MLGNTKANTTEASNNKTETKKDTSPIKENPYEPNNQVGKTKNKNLSIVTTDIKDVPNILRKDPNDEAQSEL